jgi:hypothetical protein
MRKTHETNNNNHNNIYLNNIFTTFRNLCKKHKNITHRIRLVQ